MTPFDKIAAPRGMPDVLPSDIPLLRRIETAAYRIFQLYGYEQIRTPVFEETRLFVHGIGEATDIVEKEMYTFSESSGEAESGNSITLRPEGTAPVIRAVVEHELLEQKGFWKLFYIGSMFRKERPQAGRLRQFDQIGCEAIGSSEPAVDAESVLLAAEFFRAAGLSGVEIKLNSIGCPACRADYRKVLSSFLQPRLSELCEDCHSRFQRNVFRVLDCKNPACRKIVADVPPMREHLDEDCLAHFESVRRLLSDAGVAFTLDDRLVRGFDYYTRTVFELSHSSLGARDAVCGGGRYDNLVEELGGPPAGCVGFAVGVVPTVLAIQKTASGVEGELPGPDVFLAAVNDDVRTWIFTLVTQFRAEGIRAEMDYERRSLKAQMRSANRLRARYAVVVGPDEIAQKTLKVKDMSTGAEELLTSDQLKQRLLSHS